MENIFDKKWSHEENWDLNQNLSLFALYIKYNDLKNAVTALKKNGFLSSEIRSFKSSHYGQGDFVYRQATSLLPGAMIGALLGLLVIESFSLLTNTDQTPLRSHYFTLLGVKSQSLIVFFRILFGIFFGAICGALVGIGCPRSPAKRYAFYLKQGGHVLGVHVKNSDVSALAVRIIQKTNGQDMNVLKEQKMLPV
jgi:hypothetical protein